MTCETLEVVFLLDKIKGFRRSSICCYKCFITTSYYFNAQQERFPTHLDNGRTTRHEKIFSAVYQAQEGHLLLNEVTTIHQPACTSKAACRIKLPCATCSQQRTSCNIVQVMLRQDKMAGKIYCATKVTLELGQHAHPLLHLVMVGVRCFHCEKRIPAEIEIIRFLEVKSIIV